MDAIFVSSKDLRSRNVSFSVSFKSLWMWFFHKILDPIALFFSFCVFGAAKLFFGAIGEFLSAVFVIVGFVYLFILFA